MDTQEYQQLLRDITDSLLKNRDQEVLRLTQRIIAVENQLNQFKQKQDSYFKQCELALALEKRIKILEEVRPYDKSYKQWAETHEEVWRKQQLNENKRKSLWKFWK